MVDFSTYKQLHASSWKSKKQYSSAEDPNVKRMDPVVMETNEPPSSPEIYVFPETIIGYNLRSKNWGT